MYIRSLRPRAMKWSLSGVDAKQKFDEAMLREVEEEAGCAVELRGVLRVEFSPDPSGECDRMIMRVIYLAAPVNPELPLKSVPDKESKGA